MTDLFTQMSEDQLGRLSLIEAIRAGTDAISRLTRHGETVDTKLESIAQVLGKIDTRLSLLEDSSLKHRVGDLQKDLDKFDERLRLLENADQQRKGAMSLFDWVAKNWPGVIGFAALVGLLLTKWKWV